MLECRSPVALTLVLLTGTAVAQTLSNELAADGAPPLAHIGAALEATEDYIVIGAPRHGAGLGFVYDGVTHGHRHTLRAVEPDPLESFGSAIAVSGDLALIGAPGRTAEHAGAADLFDLRTGTHITRLSPPQLEAGDRFGEAVALLDNIALIGAPGDDENATNAGRVYAYDLSDPANPVLTDRFQSPTRWPQAGFGSTIAVDGSIAAVVSHPPERGGRVHLFDLTFITSVRHRSTVTPMQGSTPHSVHGLALDDGRMLLGAMATTAGSSTYPLGTSSACLYDVSDATAPTQLGSFAPSVNGESIEYGYTVALSGHTAVIGAADDSRSYYRSGAVYTFDIADPASPVEIARFERDTALDADFVGGAVALAGNTLVAGGHNASVDGSRTGIALVFDVSPPCSPADFSRPRGVLDLSDIGAFINLYTSADPAADLEPDGLLDLGDITAFVSGFTAGCP